MTQHWRPQQKRFGRRASSTASWRLAQTCNWEAEMPLLAPRNTGMPWCIFIVHSQGEKDLWGAGEKARFTCEDRG
jgi:hypothetical protein